MPDDEHAFKKKKLDKFRTGAGIDSEDMIHDAAGVLCGRDQFVIRLFLKNVKPLASFFERTGTVD